MPNPSFPAAVPHGIVRATIGRETESMSESKNVMEGAVVAALATGAAWCATALAQAPAPTPAERAIEYRQSVFRIVSGNFGPLAQIAQGKVPFDPAKARRNADLLAAISAFLEDAHPEISKEGKTRAKPQIWTNRAEFNRRVADFGEHTRALALITARSDSATDEFKAAIGTVGNDCKGCHDNFRTK
jgi:cytochrome c556